MDSHRAQAPPDALPAAPPFAVRRGRRFRVLVVDDAAAAREHYSADLAGFDVQVAADGLEALARAVARRPDAVVINVAVPGMDGWEVVRRLKAAAATRDIPVIAVSASDHRARARASEAGCAACLAKPCRPEELREELERQLDLRRPRPRRRGRAGRV